MNKKLIILKMFFLFLSILIPTSCVQQTESLTQEQTMNDDTSIFGYSAVSAAPKIAVDSDPAWSAAVRWYYSESGRTQHGDTPMEECLFRISACDSESSVSSELYDATIIACNQETLNQFEGKIIIHLFDDAIIFVHGNPTQPETQYNLSLEKIREIYSQNEQFYWDIEQREHLIPAYGYGESSDSIWQQLSRFYAVHPTASDILLTGKYGNPVWAAAYSGKEGSPLFPCYYSFRSGEAGINGAVIAVDDVFPTYDSIASGDYPLTVSFFAVYSPDNPSANQLL